ncbi:hypothetical protein ABKV19_013367 [Rosa sericea]
MLLNNVIMSGKDVPLDEITYATSIDSLHQPNRCEYQESYGNMQKFYCMELYILFVIQSLFLGLEAPMYVGGWKLE